MNNETWASLINLWRRAFFTEPILISAFLLCFIIGLFRHQRQRERLLFTFYSFVGVLLFPTLTMIELLKVRTGRNLTIFTETGNSIFELVEFIAFYYFFKSCLRFAGAKAILKTFLIILCISISAFLFMLTYSGYRDQEIQKHSLFINVIEFLFLAVLCLAYFVELFSDPPNINLFERPSFYIVIGAFFYAALMIPFFMVARNIYQFDHAIYFPLFSCHFVLLTFLMIAIANAMICRKPITT